MLGFLAGIAIFYKVHKKWLLLQQDLVVNILNVIETMLLMIICWVTTEKIDNTSQKALKANENRMGRNLLIHC